ncbi:MAG: discoidin domain-containing protein [Bacteroides sp.]|nr:discoidin domain-containing protein [Bacteroides sp.]MCM1095271.1 discoidin domain-containing protein [Terasakiella sp.]
MNRVKTLISSMLLTAPLVWGMDYIPRYEIIDKPGYPTPDIPVVTFNVSDYGIDASGHTDCTSQVQALLDAAAGVGSMTAVNNDSKTRGWYGNPTGGIVYFPEGTYLFKGNITIPRGVTIRGDWKRPEAGVATKGTVFSIEPSSRVMGMELEGSSFIKMQPTTEVNGITFWYPGQKHDDVKKCPPTVLFGQDGYFGNDYCTVQRCTFVNSYTAIKFSSTNGGGCPDIFDIYGTPLSQGVVIDNIADVGRLDGIHFAPSYWEDCGLPGSPAPGAADAWLYENATGIVMRRNDWSYTCNVDIKGYCIGFHAEASPLNISMPGNPNGHNFRFRLKDCKTGIRISGASNSGIMFADVTTAGCDTGIDMPASVLGPVQVQGSDIAGDTYAIHMGELSSPGLQMQQCRVKGETEVAGGQFSCINSTFDGNVHIGHKARTIFAGNTFSKGNFRNESLFECIIDGTPVDMRTLPQFKDEWMVRKTTRPSRAALYVATESRFGAEPVTLFDNLKTAKDNTRAIQDALDLAAAEGGGIVYLPTGHYRVDGTITIPSGVELKGSGDLMSTPKNNGAVLETTHGEGNENAAPFITMAKGSGLRGITINYPNQTTPVAVKKYPYTIRGNADVYICNLAIRAAYRAIDLFTNKCDNHYVDYLAGHAFFNVIRVGNGSEGGIISNIQCNTIAYACGDETKFGCWPNCELMKDNTLSSKVYGQNSEDLDFMIIGDSKGQVLYNNFLFGCHQGMRFQDDGKGGAREVHSLGNAVDGAVETFVFNGGTDDIDLVNSQVVALNHDKPVEYINKDRLSASFIVTGKDFSRTVTFFSGNFWGGGDYLLKAEGGKVNLYSANLAQSGSVATFALSNGAGANFVNVYRRQGNSLFERPGISEKYCSVKASVINCNGASQHMFAAWKDNLPLIWDFTSYDDLKPRTGWRATAFNDESGTGNASNAIDSNASTRWSSEGTQTAGQWFAIDFGKSERFNTIILDSSSSPNDGPNKYKAEVYETGGWRQVATGEKGSSNLIITFDDVQASKMRVTLTASAKSGYWSIHEAYIADIKTSGISDMLPADDTATVKYEDGEIVLSGAMTDGGASVTVYNLSGLMVDCIYASTPRVSLDHLPRGIYIVEVKHPTAATQVIKIVK